MSKIDYILLRKVLLLVVTYAHEPENDTLRDQLKTFSGELERIYQLPSYTGITSLTDALEDLKLLHNDIKNVLEGRNIEQLDTAYYAHAMLDSLVANLNNERVTFAELYGNLSHVDLVNVGRDFFNKVLETSQITINRAQEVRTSKQLRSFITEESKVPLQWCTEDENLLIHFPFLADFFSLEYWEKKDELTVWKLQDVDVEWDDIMGVSYNQFHEAQSKYPHISAEEFQLLKQFCKSFERIFDWYDRLYMLETILSSSSDIQDITKIAVLVVAVGIAIWAVPKFKKSSGGVVEIKASTKALATCDVKTSKQSGLFDNQWAVCVFNEESAEFVNQALNVNATFIPKNVSQTFDNEIIKNTTTVESTTDANTLVARNEGALTPLIDQLSPSVGNTVSVFIQSVLRITTKEKMLEFVTSISTRVISERIGESLFKMLKNY